MELKFKDKKGTVKFVIHDEDTSPNDFKDIEELVKKTETPENKEENTDAK